MEAEVDPELNQAVIQNLPLPLSEVPTTVTVRARGREFTRSVRTARGDGFAATQLMDDELFRKFRINAEAILSQERIEALIEAVWNLDSAPDMSAVTSLLEVPHVS